MILKFLVNTKIFNKTGATLKWSFYISFCPPSAHRSDHKKTFPDIVPVRCLTSDLVPILYNIYTLGQNTLGQNTLGQNALGQNTLGQIYWSKVAIFAWGD